MKHLKYYMIPFLWVSALYPTFGKTFLTYRSQGFNLARNNNGWHRRCTENNASLAIECTRSFDACALNNYYFGANQLTFSGSRVADRGKQEILADYFGLPTDFKSNLSFSPSIKNIIADLDFYWLLGCDEKNRWNLRVNVPIVRTKWGLNPCEVVVAPGSADYPAGYMSSAKITRNQLPQRALDVLSGEATFGDLVTPLQYGRISSCTQELTKFSDLFVAFGCNLLCKPRGMLEMDVNVTIPTGTRSRACTLFEPQIGNGHHWGLGGGFSAEYLIDERSEDDCTVSFCVDARVQHLFGSMQKRTYDLVSSGPGSRYVLLMDMIGNISVTQGFSPVFGQDLLKNQYITRLLYAADATTLDSQIKIKLQGEATAKFFVEYRHWNFELGYNFWARSAEQLVRRQCFNHKYYGVKGDAQEYGFLDLGFIQIPLPLNATQSQSTLYKPQGAGNTVDNFVNNNADHPALIYNAGSPIKQTTSSSLVNTGVVSIQNVNGSDQAIILSDADINESSGLSPQAYSNKIFGSVGYDFEVGNAQPYFLIGAEGEFAGKMHCFRAAVSQWGVWFKIGATY